MITDICDADEITQVYGCTDSVLEWIRPDCPGGHFHAGVDLGWLDGGDHHIGSPIRTPRNGLVVAIGPRDASGGLDLGPYAVCIRTDAEGVVMQFGHASAAYVQVGDRVRAGDTVAAVGSRGTTASGAATSTGGHVHLEVRGLAIQGPPWGDVIDPTPWLRYLPSEVFLMALTDQQQQDLVDDVHKSAGVLAKLDSRVLGDIGDADNDVGLGWLSARLDELRKAASSGAPAITGGLTAAKLADALEAAARTLRETGTG